MSGARPGSVAPEVRAEFPGLRLAYETVDLGDAGRAGSDARRRSPPALRRRLTELANRYCGGAVVSMRTQAVPQAYRAFFRQIGLDPDVQRVPAERAAVQRLVDGGFRPLDRVSDACLVALVETGVPVWALDADAVDARTLGVRVAVDADLASCTPSGEAGLVISAGSLVVADGSRVHAVLFVDPAPPSAVTRRSRRVTLFSVAVPGVPDIHLEEALGLARELLGAPG